MWNTIPCTDIHQRSQNLRHLDPGMVLELGVVWFSCDQNNCGSSDAYVTCMYCGLSVKTNRRKTPHGTPRLWTHLFCVYSCVYCWQKGKDPHIEPHGWRCHYTGWYMGSLLYICGSMPHLWLSCCVLIQHSYTPRTLCMPQPIWIQDTQNMQK